MPRTRTHSYDTDDASKRGDDDAASLLLAMRVGSQQSSWAAAREKKKVDDDIFAAAGLLRSPWSAVRQKKKVDNDSFAAASTVPTDVVICLYHHGKLVKEILSPKEANNDVSTKLTVARGDGLLYSSDDDKYFNNVDEDEYEENNFSSLPQNDGVSCNHRILGGPQRPDTSKMTLREKELALDKYQKKRKAYTDAKQLEMAKQLVESDITTLLQRGEIISYSGDQTPSIRLMMAVEAHPLVAGQKFQHKETLQICIAEEANLRNIKVKIVWSSHVTYIVGGYNFYVATGYQIQTGWLVHVACCCKGNDVLRIPPSAHYYDKSHLCNPFYGKWVGYLLHSTIEDCPGVTYRVMSEVIRDNVNPYAVTNNILQDARDHAKADLFGKPDNNIRYAYAVQQAIRDMGHVCDLIFTGHRDVIWMVWAVVLKE
jgi:hypothetical protein